MDFDEDYDVVCVGSGAGGLAAGIVASAGGARVLVIEKDDKVGGVTALTGGQIWIAPNPYQNQYGIVDCVEDAMAYIDFLAADLGSAVNRLAYVSKGSEALECLRELGLKLSSIPQYADYYYPEAPGSKAEGRYLEPLPFAAASLGEWAERTIVGQGAMTSQHGGSWLTNADLVDAGSDPQILAAKKAERMQGNLRCMGSGLIANLVDMALRASVDIWTGAPAIRLLGEQRVEGVVIGGDGAERRIKARSVVLATGAYDWSPELVETHEFIKNMFSLTPPTITGDHFKLASQFRAATATTLPQGCSRHVGINIPGETWGGKPFYRMMIMGLPHCMMVNSRGCRFGDESFFHTYSSSAYELDGHHQNFPNWPAWFVFDQNSREKYAIGPISPGDTLPEGMAMKADSIAELAHVAGIDPNGLGVTVDRFNTHAVEGIDPDYARGSKLWSHSWGDSRMLNPNLGPLNKPPYYAMRLERVGTGLASAGLKTDESARVIGIHGLPIEGLYAVGNSAARIEMGCGYNSGMAIGRSLVFGYLAARHAVSR
ncbi:MAG: hypothetical protein JWO15_2408 [Sphingomonadales bacterium]|nr:hypothetical protein [Sphingomonadales bacterium]